MMRTSIPRSARVSRANASPARTDGVLAIANFHYLIVHRKRLFRRDAETNTRDACATQM